MKSELCFSETPAVSITITQAMAYLFCPRFTYFEECLGIPEHEETRFKVLMGREVHARKIKINPDYLRKRINVVRKAVSVYLASPTLQLRGIVDEVLWLADGTLAPLEYKFAEYRPFVFGTHRTQLCLQALLISEAFAAPVTRGYLVYVRSKNFLREVPFRPNDFHTARRAVQEVLRIIQSGRFPRQRGTAAQCADCCYRNLCV
ncbi:MAG: CRISPR-associated protein Cas4 [candidate division KSB1 bacterium]|nr:CRISPR-associated protein Cas4 [candidate division KSB1 bacterium]MDZ7413425.1 CRISPR-associated protein Cas4 [candidate division KSB1 bacterium]